MRLTGILLGLGLGWLLTPVLSPAAPVDWVNAYIGTGGGGTEYGGTVPAVEPPFAMTTWTPQTRQNRVSVSCYAYEDRAISGFMCTHQPAIWMGDYGYVTVMPGVDAVKTAPQPRQLPFSHADETVSPYYYSVAMDAGGGRKLGGQITATEHCAILRFLYPANPNASLVVEVTRPKVNGTVSLDPAAQEIDGCNPDRMDARLTTLQLPHFCGYSVVQIRKPFAGFGAYAGSTFQTNATHADGPNVGAYVTFPTKAGESVLVKIGTSFISLDQARANLQAEIPGWNFDRVKSNLRKTWNQKLAQVSLEGGTTNQVTEFYTAMYHAMLYPRQFSEQGRYYSAFDDQVHAGVAYTDYSLWDTFRAENSFITLLCPERVDGMVQGLLNDFREGGWMPKWPNPSYTGIMVGTHADSIVAEAINKGFHGFDRHLAYQAVYQDAMVPPNEDASHRWNDRQPGHPYSAREGLTTYRALGYVANDHTARAASCTLEGAYDDWCVAQVARADGKMEDYQFFLKRSLSYRNLFHAETGLLEARNADGSWAGRNNGWTEGGQSQNAFAVWHDVPGLIELMGGSDQFNRKLAENPADLTNEPGEHYPYLFDFSGQPWQAQRLSRAGLDNYANTPAGLPGNDDCGQLSAWWIFTALGFYPVNPASGTYLIGSPLFKQAKLHLPNGKTFVVQAINNSATNLYIQSATLNGGALTIPCITYAQIEAGGTLALIMGPSPSHWAADWRGEKVQ